MSRAARGDRAGRWVPASARPLRLLLALALGVLLCSNLACTKCRASGDCASNQHCDYSTGECLSGCTDGTQCSSGQCNTATGKCVPADLPDFDAEVSMDARTATTSTTTDAGV